jgi:hypothetical protein
MLKYLQKGNAVSIDSGTVKLNACLSYLHSFHVPMFLLKSSFEKFGYLEELFCGIELMERKYIIWLNFIIIFCRYIFIQKTFSSEIVCKI